MRPMLAHLSATFLFLSSLLWAPLASAFQVSPMIQQMDAYGAGSNAQYRIDNKGGSTLAVEAVVKRRVLDEEGNETLVDAEADFLVLPPMAQVDPGDFQVFRVRYLGEPLPETDSFRVIFQQLPIKNEQEGSGVKLLFNFATLVFVNPPKATALADLQVTDVANDTLTLSVGNQGSRVLDLSEHQWQLRSKEGRERLYWSAVQPHSPARFVMPGQTLNIELPADVTGPLSGDVTMELVKP